MTRHDHPELLKSILQLLTDEGSEAFAASLGILVNEAMRAERSAVLQAQPFERTEARTGYANGFKPKTLTTRLGPITFAVPQVRGDIDLLSLRSRKGRAQRAGPQARPRRTERSEIAKGRSLCPKGSAGGRWQMYVQGVSTRKVAAVLEELCGTSVSSTHVSHCAARLDAELESWRSRPLAAFPYVILDARYEKVRHGGRVIDCAVLIALGIGPDGKRQILGASVALSEAEVHWRDFPREPPKARPLQLAHPPASLVPSAASALQLLVSDEHAGLGAARRAVFPLRALATLPIPPPAKRPGLCPPPRSARQSRRRHPQRLPRPGSRARSSQAPRNRRRLRRHRSKAFHLDGAKPPPRVDGSLRCHPAGCLSDSLSRSARFTVFELPPTHQRRLRTSNALERVNQELKRRTRVASIFPNEASLLRLTCAVLAEISDDWLSSKIYLDMNPSTPPST